MTVSLRTRVIALVLAAALPAVALLAHTGHELEERVVRAAEAGALQHVRSMAAHHERIVENARLLLAALARTAEARALDPEPCRELLQGVQRGNPVYVSLALADAGGRMVAGAPEPRVAGLADVAGAGCFRAALAGGGFATGDYVHLPEARRVVLHFAQGVRGPQGVPEAEGQGRGVLLAAFDLNHFGGLFEAAGLPPGSVFTLTDAGGMRLTRFPETEKYTWVQDLPRMIERMSAPQGEGVFRETGVDGVQRLYAYKRLRFEGAPFAHLMIRLGIPLDEALAQARGTVRRNLALLLGAVALSAGLAWLLAEVAVVRRLKGLLGAAERVGQGDLQARAGLSDGDEIGRLGQAFDAMAKALQEREAERQAFENEVCHLNEFLEERVEQRTRELGAANKELTQAMERLSQAHRQLVQSEKMASLGALVAGVAHEINTPVGIGVTAASHLDDRTREVREDMAAGGLKRSALEQFLATCGESAQLILTNLRRASDLIRSFKQVAVDRSTEERRSFRLREYVEQVLLSLRPRLKKTAIVVDLDCDPELAILSYPGVFSQILTNLVLNSLQHGFDCDSAETCRAGRIGITLKAEQDRLRFTFTDDGHGIAPEHLDKIFEPFYTTYRQKGGSGLGLSIVYNLVTQTLGGTIFVASTPGQGATFTISVPLEGPPKT